MELQDGKPLSGIGKFGVGTGLETRHAGHVWDSPTGPSLPLLIEKVKGLEWDSNPVEKAFLKFKRKQRKQRPTRTRWSLLLKSSPKATSMQGIQGCYTAAMLNYINVKSSSHV
ncbi:hypothetical protein FF1_040088 [Malus domestica]